MKKLVIRTKLEFEECFFDNFEEIIDGNEYLGCLDVVSTDKYLVVGYKESAMAVQPFGWKLIDGLSMQKDEIILFAFDNKKELYNWLAE